ncbi:MAG: ABC transporter permease [Patescibacteria group bacterium]|nr:ABC transporter permease [Patescibacteria group bacterium]
MWLYNAVKISLRNLAASKLRSFLTVLGVVIGVASVIIIFSVGISAQELILDQIKGIGSNLVIVLPGASNEDGSPTAVFGIMTTTFTYDDLQALRNKKNVPEVEAAAGYVLGTTVASSKNEEKLASFTGVTASYLEVESTQVERGRFFTEEEERGLARVTVLGVEIADELFPDEDPINKNLKVGDQKYMVVGVLEERGAAAFGATSQDDTIFVPLKTAQKLIMGINHLGFARLKIEDAQLIDLAKENVTLTLRDRHNISNPENDDFSVRDQASALETLTTVTNALRYFLLAIGTVSLVVGGVGIMNIMLIAVSQRIKEVGTRKAVGAKNSDILTQFIIESSAVSFLGGIVGVVLGVLVSFVVSFVVQYLGYNWPFRVSLLSILVASLISIMIGVSFGLYPAKKASKISPMEALRYE